MTRRTLHDLRSRLLRGHCDLMSWPRTPSRRDKDRWAAEEAAGGPGAGAEIAEEVAVEEEEEGMASSRLAGSTDRLPGLSPESL